MPRKLALLAGSVVVAALTSFAASAAPAVPASGTPEASILHEAQWGGSWRDRDYRYRDWRHDGYYHGCRAWRHRCAARWGWGGWEFRRCLHRHGCGGGYRY
jgi:hypothetical protein